jgi:hypothetical protein
MTAAALDDGGRAPGDRAAQARTIDGAWYVPPSTSRVGAFIHFPSSSW